MKQYLAVFTGSKTNEKMKAWYAMDEVSRRAKEQEGIMAWGKWMERYHDVVVFQGSPLGKTKKIDPSGISDISNQLAAFTVVKAESYDAAAKIFENHPHFSIFPGDSVEVMECLPIPGQ